MSQIQMNVKHLQASRSLRRSRINLSSTMPLFEGFVDLLTENVTAVIKYHRLIQSYVLLSKTQWLVL